MKKEISVRRAIMMFTIVLLSASGCKKDAILSEGPQVDLKDEALMSHNSSIASSVRVGTLAQNIPLGWIAANLSTGNLYVTSGSVILKITQSGTVSTLAGNPNESGFRNGTGSAARFSGLQGITVDRYGNIFVCDSRNHVIRKVTPSGVVSTFAGTGTAGYVNGSRLSSKFNTPMQITSKYSSLYVFDEGNARIRKIYDGKVTTIAGSGVRGVLDGRASQAQVDAVSGMVLDRENSLIFVDHNEGTIRRLKDGYVKTIVKALNSDGLANFALPQGLTISSLGHLFVADAESNKIKRVVRTSSGYGVSLVAGSVEGFQDGTGLTAQFYYPQGITWYKNRLFVLEQNRAVRKITLPD